MIFVVIFILPKSPPNILFKIDENSGLLFFFQGGEGREGRSHQIEIAIIRTALVLICKVKSSEYLQYSCHVMHQSSACIKLKAKVIIINSGIKFLLA